MCYSWSPGAQHQHQRMVSICSYASLVVDILVGCTFVVLLLFPCNEHSDEYPCSAVVPFLLDQVPSSIHEHPDCAGWFHNSIQRSSHTHRIAWLCIMWSPDEQSPSWLIKGGVPTSTVSYVFRGYPQRNRFYSPVSWRKSRRSCSGCCSSTWIHPDWSHFYGRDTAYKPSTICVLLMVYFL
jgi:hypothetical protein